MRHVTAVLLLATWPAACSSRAITAADGAPVQPDPGGSSDAHVSSDLYIEDAPSPDCGLACASCSELNQAYMAAVQQAKSCCPTCLVDEQCTLMVWDALPTGCPCPCQTHVNASNTAALQLMKLLEQQWMARPCGPGLPPPSGMTCCALYPACQELEMGATCAGSGPQGTCVDNPSP